MIENIKPALSRTFSQTGAKFSLGVYILYLAVRLYDQGYEKLLLDRSLYYGIIPASIAFVVLFVHYLKVESLLCNISDLERENIDLADTNKHLTVQIKLIHEPMIEALKQSIKRDDINESAKKDSLKSVKTTDNDVMFSRKSVDGRDVDKIRGVSALLVFDVDTYAIKTSKNVSSVTDNGVNDISLNFAKQIKGTYLLGVTSDSDVKYDIVEQSPNSARIRFKSGVRGVLRVAAISMHEILPKNHRVD